MVAPTGEAALYLSVSFTTGMSDAVIVICAPAWRAQQPIAISKSIFFILYLILIKIKYLHRKYKVYVCKVSRCTGVDRQQAEKKDQGQGMPWPHTKFFLSLKIKNAEIC
jgi:hypothetical protein